MHVFNQLFDHPMTILGGGIYDFELAKKHKVIAIDLVDKHIKVLKEK